MIPQLPPELWQKIRFLAANDWERSVVFFKTFDDDGGCLYANAGHGRAIRISLQSDKWESPLGRVQLDRCIRFAEVNSDPREWTSMSPRDTYLRWLMFIDATVTVSTCAPPGPPWWATSDCGEAVWWATTDPNRWWATSD